MAGQTRTDTPATSKPKQRRLGRGLSSLLSSEAPVRVEAPNKPEANQSVGHSPVGERPGGGGGLILADVARCAPNPHQPRTAFDEGSLAALAESIRARGVMQPVVVRPAGEPGRYQIVAGERRWRAAQLAGVSAIPAIVRELSDQDTAEWAVIENIQREDLNPIERAHACRTLVNTFGLNQSAVADRLGIDRSSVSNLLRILELEPEILELIAAGSLGLGHAKALLAAPAGTPRIALATRAARDGASVRSLERVAAPSRAQPGATAPRDASIEDLERQLSEHLGTKVRVSTNKKGDKGRISVPFYSLEHFDDLMRTFGFRLRDG